MTAIASPAPRRTSTATAFAGVRIPVWIAVICSRLIVLCAGAGGALFTHRSAGWATLDPHRISTSLGSVGNVLAAPVLPWDGVGYVTLAEHGYTTTGSTVLFPLYSLLIRGAAEIVRSPVVAGVLISLTAFAVGLALVHRIASEEIGPRAADATVLLLAFSPFSFVFSAVYTESLLLALSAAAFHLARRGRFVPACVAAACAAVTHVQGILLVAPLALMYWDSRGRPRDLRRLWSPSLPALALPGAALAGLFAYMHSQGFSWLAPITSQNMADAGRTLVGPPIMLFDAVRAVATGLDQGIHGAAQAGGPFTVGFQNLIYLVVLAIAILSLVGAWRRLPREYAVFATLVILVCTSSAVAMVPLKGFDRYILPIFPLWISAAAWLQERRLMPAVLTASTVMLAFYTVEFARWVAVF